MEHWGSIIEFAGGVGLFLLGMRLMSDGLKIAAGPALRHLLSTATGSLGRAVASGMLITALVQSSSAVVFATIGFVNAGLLSLGQAVGVVFGANVGTTLTSWIVALVGLDIKLQAFALPAIALGMASWITGKGRRAALGQAVVGFGVFFLGLDVLKSAFSDLDPSWALAATGQGGWLLDLMFLLIGVVLTLLMQSSSAALAVTLSAAAQGVVPLSAAAAMVIGANVGTTSTALFASIGATEAARRTAAAHVVFNIFAGVLAYLSLSWLLQGSLWLAGLLGGAEQPATVLAVLHSVINLLGLLAIWPLTPYLVRWLENHFVARDQSLKLAKHLDRTVLATPSLAVEAVLLELQRLASLASGIARAVLSQEPGSELDFSDEHPKLERLATEIMAFVPQIETAGVAVVEHTLPRTLRVAQYLRAAGERAVELGHQAPVAGSSADLVDSLAALHAAAGQSLTVCQAEGGAAAKLDADSIGQAMDQFEQRYQETKAHLLDLGSRGRIGSASLVRVLDRCSGVRRVVGQIGKAALLQAAIESERRPSGEAEL